MARIHRMNTPHPGYSTTSIRQTTLSTPTKELPTNMSELILHHYSTSPFSEKTRLMLGYKGLSWRSVTIAPIMPKPELTALTGGYRKTPVLQIGADIYCDTALIARQLEHSKALPSLFPDDCAFAAAILAAWADSTLFQHAVAFVFQPESLALRFAKAPPELFKAFVADRRKLFEGGNATRVSIEQARNQWPVFMARLEQQLAHRGDFLFGQPSIADFAVAHPLWFLRQTPVTAPWVEQYPEVLAWLARVEGFGHGSFSAMTGVEALDVALGSEPAALPDKGLEVSDDVRIGQQVSVSAEDYGVDPVVGQLMFLGEEELIVRREEERTGVVHVHFPRLGFRVSAV